LVLSAVSPWKEISVCLGRQHAGRESYDGQEAVARWPPREDRANRRFGARCCCDPYLFAEQSFYHNAIAQRNNYKREKKGQEK